ncbi:uncharacterized protein B0J16DRAFT_381982 [Fusarium flagelliforme]|uniref:Uncharacterized protein n=1 Tax=Fusarium flagelliforme TaxID=2675880 RepID=A0A395N335_9HYPO|nr:uncharacterized protein B0J16DRAFT_381982 [Fusarium flagelliforme]KAH7188098.1 hypothetical protein B0J16DRAFT_381982 [Fusarium flagelliforme]RFN54534.1 hypothetical protein FIE12Z_1189 [Fusarium flagelliforme]
MVVQELGAMGVKPGLDIMNATTPEGKILYQAWKTCLQKPGGPSRLYYGLEEDNPLKIWAFFDWDTIQQHEKFAIEYGGDAVKDIPKICTHGEMTKHVEMVPSSDVFQSPMTEIFLAYFPTDFPEAEKHKATAKLQNIFNKSFRDCSDVVEVAYSWSVENDWPVRKEREVVDGQLGSALVGFVGWASDVAQEDFRQTATYKEAVAKIRGLNGLASLDIISLECKHMERADK